jgi:hypothetical protein
LHDEPLPIFQIVSVRHKFPFVQLLIHIVAHRNHQHKDQDVPGRYEAPGRARLRVGRGSGQGEAPSEPRLGRSLVPRGKLAYNIGS